LQLAELFGKVLRERRQMVGLSQEKLALEANFNRTFISMLERGIRQPTLKTLFRLGKALEVSPAELILLVETECAEAGFVIDSSED